MKTFMRILMLNMLVITVLSCNRAGTPPKVNPLPEEASYSLHPEVSLKQYQVERSEILRNQNLADIMQANGVEYSVVNKLVEASKGVFDLRKLKVGNGYSLHFSPDSNDLVFMVYEESLRSHIAFFVKDSIRVERHEIALDSKAKMVEITLNQSLWADLELMGENPLLAISLSEIYAWTIDFFGLQKGDRIIACYDALYSQGKEVELGSVNAALFIHGGKDYYAYRFMQDSVYGYWDANGVNLQKAFLKAPLRYSRISSGFSYSRRHPVTRKVRPHTGIDYAAPTGTPVVSIGEGVVTQRAYAGGGGNTIKIKHNGVYTSGYLHLSRFAKGLTVGKRVSQGEVIGYVGSTGTSTGPHLDFRIWKNGQPVNPLTMEAPPADPILDENAGEFAAIVEKWSEIINASLQDSQKKSSEPLQQ